jgi:7,8-dihydroneopterin aldolase/epimerase/oxygenase
MDLVYIRALQIETVIGIYDWERSVKQSVVLDLEMATDIRRAAASENINDALDYAAISQRLNEFVGGGNFLLIEALAEQCAALIMCEFNVPWLRLRLAKPTAVAAASEVGVVIERGERPA